MIQEKDFLYRVPVKTAPITTPGGQIRNPEILVDLEGGEFMHGNILDANSTNKLINQSVKDAVANDKDGYTGIQFCRWVADVVGKKENIDWDKFK